MKMNWLMKAIFAKLWSKLISILQNKPPEGSSTKFSKDMTPIKMKPLAKKVNLKPLPFSPFLEFKKLVQNFQDKSLTDLEIEKIYYEIVGDNDSDNMTFEQFKDFTSYPKEMFWFYMKVYLNFIIKKYLESFNLHQTTTILNPYFSNKKNIVNIVKKETARKLS